MSVKAGDTVEFLNAGNVFPAEVVRVDDDGTLDLRFQGPDYAAPVIAHGVPQCPDGGSYGWQAIAADRGAAGPQAAAEDQADPDAPAE
jgi:hypothetical protein